MTTQDEAQRTGTDLRREGLRLKVGRFDSGRAAAEAARLAALPRPVPLAERLYAAREEKGVDLYRAERDTKIRARYLAALERGEYKELPGDVYTKGFLRNYANYLGLDAEEVVGQWRRELGDQKPKKTVLAVPRPISQPRKGLQFSPGIVVAALLTILIIAVGVWLGVQVMRFAKPPTLALTAPREAAVLLEQGTATYTLEGTSIPGATITIEMAGGSRTTSADSTGEWSLTIPVNRGRNEFKIDATDPETGKHAEQPAQIVLSVPFLENEAPRLTVDQPAPDTTFENGAIAVGGTATNATSVQITARYDGPVTGAPTSSNPPSAAPGSPAGPAALNLPVGDDGTWNTGANPLQLSTGRWTITVTATDGAKSATQTRNVSVAYRGVNLVVTLEGGSAWVKVWVDGEIAPTVGRAGKVFRDGQVLTFTGKSSIEVRTGSSGATQFTLNGKALGSLGRRGVPETWLFKPPAAPTLTQRK